MNETISMTLRLFIITFVASLLLGGTYVLTKDTIAKQDEKTATEARQQVIDAQQFDKLDVDTSSNADYSSIEEVYVASDSNNKVVGATIKLTTKGFKPGINMTVGIKLDGTISGVNIGDNEETAGLGAKCTDKDFYSQYTGKAADGKLEVQKNKATADNQIVAIAGATITSKGVTKGVNLAADFFNDVVKSKIS